MTPALVLILFAAPSESVTAEAILALWQARQAEIASADLSWRIIRDSRSVGFGEAGPDGAGRSWRLRFGGNRRRVDLDQLVVTSRDGRTRPLPTDPDQARLEFRYRLLEEHLGGPPPAPVRSPLSVTLPSKFSAQDDRMGPLEHLLSEAPLLACRPLDLVDGSGLVLTDRLASGAGRSCPVVEECSPAGVFRELWVEPEAMYRIVRVVEYSRGHAVGEIDFRHDEVGPVPDGWTALRLSGDGDVLEFATAERTELRLNPEFPPDTFDDPSGSPDEPAPAAFGVRGLMRSVADWGWLPALVTVGGIALRRARPSRPAGRNSSAEAPMPRL